MVRSSLRAAIRTERKGAAMGARILAECDRASGEASRLVAVGPILPPPRDGPGQPLIQGDAGLPAEELAGQADVGASPPRVIDGQRFKDDLAPAPTQVADHPG